MLKKITPITISRICYVLAHGDIPEGMTVDHIDGDFFNNRPDNLRLLGKVENVVSYFENIRKEHIQALFSMFYLKPELTKLDMFKNL